MSTDNLNDIIENNFEQETDEDASAALYECADCQTRETAEAGDKKTDPKMEKFVKDTADLIDGKQEIGEAAFDAIATAMRGKSPEEAKKIIDAINKELEKRGSKYALEETFSFRGLTTIATHSGHETSKGIALIDKEKAAEERERDKDRKFPLPRDIFGPAGAVKTWRVRDEEHIVSTTGWGSDTHKVTDYDYKGKGTTSRTETHREPPFKPIKKN